MENIENIAEIFLASLRFFVTIHKSQRQFAAKVGITPQYLNKMLLGKNYGSEEIRRKIAAALGYGPGQYEEFLNVGRQELGLPAGQEQSLAKTNQSEEDSWQIKYLILAEKYMTLQERLLTLQDERNSQNMLLLRQEARIAELEARLTALKPEREQAE